MSKLFLPACYPIFCSASLVSHTYFFLEGGVAEIRMVTIASFLEIIAILGQDSGRANEITDPAKVM